MIKEIIAIDGPAASGKSTVARLIAERLNYIYIDSGAMYRCIALYMLENNIALADIVDRLKEIKIEFKSDSQIYLNNNNVSEKIRTAQVTKLVPQVAAIKKVREYLVEVQQGYGKDKGIVMDGRDIGTVVFKDAKVKIYQVASVKTRAMRRHQENLNKKMKSNLDQIIFEIEKRDFEDMNRSVSPLIKADDAIEIDTSNMSIEESVDAIIEIFKKKVNNND